MASGTENLYDTLELGTILVEKMYEQKAPTQPTCRFFTGNTSGFLAASAFRALIGSFVIIILIQIQQNIYIHCRSTLEMASA